MCKIDISIIATSQTELYWGKRLNQGLPFTCFHSVSWHASATLVLHLKSVLFVVCIFLERVQSNGHIEVTVPCIFHDSLCYSLFRGTQSVQTVRYCQGPQVDNPIILGWTPLALLDVHTLLVGMWLPVGWPSLVRSSLSQAKAKGEGGPHAEARLWVARQLVSLFYFCGCTAWILHFFWIWCTYNFWLTLCICMNTVMYYHRSFSDWWWFVQFLVHLSPIQCFYVFYLSI